MENRISKEKVPQHTYIKISIWLLIIFILIFWIKSAKQKSMPENNSKVEVSVPIPKVQQNLNNFIEQMPDQYMPCTVHIGKIQDLYTDGTAIYILPPGWPLSEKIYYSGHGHLIIRGGNIHTGDWKFWVAGDSVRTGLLRIWQKN